MALGPTEVHLDPDAAVGPMTPGRPHSLSESCFMACTMGLIVMPILRAVLKIK